VIPTPSTRVVVDIGRECCSRAATSRPTFHDVRKRHTREEQGRATGSVNLLWLAHRAEHLPSLRLMQAVSLGGLFNM
jgi:hypothetical protein